MILFWFQSDWIIMQQVPVSNIIMSIKSPKRSIVKKWLFRLFHQAVLPRDSRQSEVPVGVWRKMCWSQRMDDITSHLASCHLSKCSKCSKDNENELILARVRIRGLVGIRNWNDNLPKAQKLNSLCTDPPPLRKNRRRGPFSEEGLGAGGGGGSVYTG